MADRQKTGRIVGTAAAIGLAISVLAIIYMAMRPNGPSHADSNRLFPRPVAQTPNQ